MNNEEVQFCLDETKQSMQKIIDHVVSDFSKIRAGKASPEMVKNIFVDYYGTNTPMYQIANINTPDTKNILIQPWEKSSLDVIEKAIKAANIGVTPQNDGNVIRITLPPLTEERRKDYVKNARNFAEHGRIGIRNSRKDANDYLKKMQKDGLSEDELKDAETKIQGITNTFITQIDNILVKKEEDILKV